MDTTNRNAQIIVFLTVFIDLLGFGIMIPLLPFFSKNMLHINESMIGLVAGIFSLMQFVFTPIWGSLSDRYGRKPILLMSLAGSVISYILLSFVFSGVILSVTLLLVSRAFAGTFAANISAAQAVISDTTTKENRTKGLGMLGAAFGMGFVFGPAIGGLLAERFGFAVPIYFSAGLSLIAFLFCLFTFKETLSKDILEENKRKHTGFKIFEFGKAKDLVRNPALGTYVITFFVLSFAFACIFGTFQLFAEREDGLALNTEQVGFLFSALGIAGAVVQGGVIRIFKDRFGDKRTMMIGKVLVCAGLLMIPFSTNVVLLSSALMTLGIGSGLANPSVLSLISQNVSPTEQGSILGINQSLGSFARFLGPVWGGFVYQKISYSAPFFTGALFMAILFFITLHKFTRPKVTPV